MLYFYLVLLVALTKCMVVYISTEFRIFQLESQLINRNRGLMSIIIYYIYLIIVLKSNA